jgi:hypothetical protein
MLIYKNVLHTDWDRLTRNGGGQEKGMMKLFCIAFVAMGKELEMRFEKRN